MVQGVKQGLFKMAEPDPNSGIHKAWTLFMG